MDAPLNRDEYSGQVMADLYKQQRLTTIKYRAKKGRAFLDFKFGEAKPRTDTVVREMVNADKELIQLQNRKMHADHQVLIMRAVLSLPGLSVEDDAEGGDDEA